MASTVPMPLLIATLLEPVTFQRKTADWPRSIVDGSTVNAAITGVPDAAGAVVPGAVVAAGAGGGGGGIGVFLLHADAKASRASANVRAAWFERNRNGE